MQGRTRKTAPAVFASFCAQKEDKLSCPLKSKTPAFVYFGAQKKEYRAFPLENHRHGFCRRRALCAEAGRAVHTALDFGIGRGII